MYFTMFTRNLAVSNWAEIMKSADPFLKFWSELKNPCNSKRIFYFTQGKHPKIKSLLWHEDINKKLQEYLMKQNCDVKVKNFKEFIESEIFPKIGIEEKKTISERTANIWLKELGWTYQRQHKDIYYDGHERDDVVKYRKIFLTQMEEFERLMPRPDEN